MNLRLRILVAALPSAIGAVAAQWHTSCVFDRLDDPHALCILSYFWYPPAMDVAFALLVLAPFLGDGVEPGIAVFKRRRLGTFLSCSSCPPFTKTLPTFWWTSNQGMFIIGEHRGEAWDKRLGSILG